MIPVVIGAAYGDEGKGATVNRLARPESVVVRFNGGCQAGHTVVEQGTRHVFSHIGSGTLKGAATYLSRHFVCNPAAFLAELYSLKSLGVMPLVWCSPDCLVTTIFDMEINRAVERQRGSGRHGSVGVGFNETIERNLHPRYTMTVGQLSKLSNDEIRFWLKRVLQGWSQLRCDRFAINSSQQMARFMDDGQNWLNLMVSDINQFLFHVRIIPDETIMRSRSPLIFEGAQGLMLDQTYGTFPYVTRSNTGLKNVVELVPGAPLKVYYVTRTYTTRHGPGPLPYELPKPPYPGIVDNTNVHSEWQGPLRFSYLNVDTLQAAVLHDRKNLPDGSESHLHFTCQDQVPDQVKYRSGGKLAELPKAQLVQDVAAACDCKPSDLPV